MTSGNAPGADAEHRLREEIEDTREQLADTVDALAAKADVKAAAQHWVAGEQEHLQQAAAAAIALAGTWLAIRVWRGGRGPSSD
jgi:hypothetical protein